MDLSNDQIYAQITGTKDFFEKAKLIAYLKEEKEIPLTEISRNSNIKSSYLCHILRLRKLPTLIVDGYYSKMITISHLFIISRLSENKQMIDAYEKILSDNLTVADTENMVREILYGVKNEGEMLDRESLKAAMNAVENKNESTVNITQTRRRAKILIEFIGNPAKTSPKLLNLIQKLQKDL